MNSQRFAESNTVMHAPKDMEDCCDVHAWKGNDVSGRHVIITAYRPTPEELTKLNLGEPLFLTIYGQGMPPVALSTDNPWHPPKERE